MAGCKGCARGSYCWIRATLVQGLPVPDGVGRREAGEVLSDATRGRCPYFLQGAI